MESKSTAEPNADEQSRSETRENFKKFVAEFSAESDRACVVVGAARLDTLLKRLLSSFLLPSAAASDELLDGDSPLGTFSARIHACHRLGLIDAEFARALNLIRRIRNEFAHESAAVSLADRSHRDRIQHLVSPLRNVSIYQTFLKMPQLGQAQGAAREFRAALAFVCARLEGAADRASRLSVDQRTTLFVKEWVNPTKKAKKGAS